MPAKCRATSAMRTSALAPSSDFQRGHLPATTPAKRPTMPTTTLARQSKSTPGDIPTHRRLPAKCQPRAKTGKVQRDGLVISPPPFPQDKVAWRDRESRAPHPTAIARQTAKPELPRPQQVQAHQRNKARVRTKSNACDRFRQPTSHRRLSRETFRRIRFRQKSRSRGLPNPSFHRQAKLPSRTRRSPSRKQPQSKPHIRLATAIA